MDFDLQNEQTNHSSAAVTEVTRSAPPTKSLSETIDKGKRSKRRKTSHLKMVPETLEAREALRERCEAVAAKLDKSSPMNKDAMEKVSREILDQAGLSEGYLGWTMVMLSSAFFRDSVAAVPPSRRLFLLPHCLKHAEGCPADYDEFGMDCKRCGACSIADFRTQAEDMGYRVLVAEGSPVVLKIIVSGYVDAIVGVACLNVLEKAIDKILLAGIPCMAVPLLSSDCRNTKVDEKWVSDMINIAHDDAAKQKTRSYVHLMRASSDMFAQPRLNHLLQRQRGETILPSDVGVDQVDPIESCEAITAEFLSRGGKYSRPFMTLATYDAMGQGTATLHDGNKSIENYPDWVFRSAMAIEMFHKASLIHDDIEDDDQFRYGTKSLHSRFGIPIAINLGDYMIGQGYRMVARHSRDMGPDVASDILDYLSNAHMRLAEGQGAELMWRERADKHLSPLDALKIYALKTAPAFEVALYAGIRMAVDAQPYTEQVKTFSRNIGVAFQILNDLKDWQSDNDNKLNSGSDVLNGRPTILLALALQGLNADDREELLTLINSSTERSMSHSQRIMRVRSLYEKAGVFDQALRLVDKHQERAEMVVDQFENEAMRRLLFYLVDTVLERPSEKMLEITHIGGLGAKSVSSAG